MIVVRRAAAGCVVAGVVLLGGPAWAQDADPCAPGPDGSVPEMCQGGMPVSDTGTVGMEPEQPCPSQPFEPGDGVVSDEDQGIAAGEPDPGAPTEPTTEPAPAAAADTSHSGAAAQDGVMCAFGLPVAAPAAPEVAAGGGTAVNGAVGAGQLPRTGPYDRVLSVAGVGALLVVAGAGAIAAGRRLRPLPH